MTTNARVHTQNDCHWYYPNGDSCYELPKKDGKGMKVPTLADAKKLNLLPSVTTVLKILPKPELQNWIVEQAVLAVLTTPRIPGEPDDAFVHRVLHVEEVQNQERDTAREKGVAIHGAIEAFFTGEEVPADMRDWIMPAIASLNKYGKLATAEKILVGDGYAGRTDLILDGESCWWIFDTKATKKLPDPKKGAWSEHVIQLSAYAAAFHRMTSKAGGIMDKPIRTANCYISTVTAGEHVICEHEEDWQRHFNDGFMRALHLWQYLNSYRPALA